MSEQSLYGAGLPARTKIRTHHLQRMKTEGHKWAMLTAASITLPAAGAAVVQSNTVASLAHAQVGIFVACAVGVQLVLGSLTRAWLRSEKQPPHYWTRFRLAHR